MKKSLIVKERALVRRLLERDVIILEAGDNTEFSLTYRFKTRKSGSILCSECLSYIPEGCVGVRNYRLSRYPAVHYLPTKTTCKDCRSVSAFFLRSDREFLASWICKEGRPCEVWHITKELKPHVYQP